MPKISVIVPVYNVEKYLNRCIDSILNQSFEDFELILVDDGSPDNSGKICDEYAQNDARVKVIHKENGGLSDARNAGIEIAQGEFLSFIDSDDWVKEEYLNILYTNAINFDADISAVNLHKEYDERIEKASNVECGIYSGVDSLKFLYNSKMSIYVNVACAKLYKKELFNETRYPVGKLHEDGFTTYKLYYKAKKVHFSNDDLYCYYQRGNSIMNETFSVRRVDEFFVYKERAQFFKDKRLYNLFLENEKTRLSCILSLTIKLIESDIDKSKKRECFKLFRDDIKENKKIIIKNSSKKQKITVNLYLISEMLFYCFHRALGSYRKFKKEIRAKRIIKELKKENLKAQRKYKDNYAFLVMTPIGGNLGDHALMVAQYNLFSQIHFVELPCPNFPYYFDNIELFKKIIKNKPIIFNAGGYLGTLWYQEAEQWLRKTIETFPNNKIVILPNTCYYENSDWGQEEFEKSKEIYNKHKNLKIYVREKISYDLIKDAYKDVTLMPDMVMSLNYSKEEKRDGCLLCLRADVEKTLANEELEKIKATFSSIFERIAFTDTVVPKNISRAKRSGEIYQKMDEFSKSQLVVTDRLHGMVFAAITGTPCIVVKSKSHKLKGCYEWIKHLEYICFVDDLNDIEMIAKKLIQKQYKYDSSPLTSYYSKLRDEVYEWLKGEL